MPGGALPVPGADQIIPVIHRLIPLFPLVVASQDWHPEGHVSFSMWPPHCVQRTWGAELVIPTVKCFQKGVDPQLECYSAFGELDPYLKGHGATHLFIVGVATEYCVFHTARDALALGWRVSILTDACQAIDTAAGQQALEQLLSQGATLIAASSL